MKSKINIQNLIEEAKNNKQQAQTKLVNIFWADVKSYVLFLTKEENIAEELTISIFSKALSKLSLYNSDFDFKTWLISIAHNHSIDYLRKKKNISIPFTEDFNSDVYDFEPSPEEKFIEKQNTEDFEKLLSKLPENYQKIIHLRYLEDKKLKEISEITNLSLSNIKVSLMRAKKLLSELLQKK